MPSEQTMDLGWDETLEETPRDESGRGPATNGVTELDETHLEAVAGGVRFQRNNLSLFTLDIG